ncbi:PAS domain S-box protein [Saccharicrinis sp. 156]|uniref:PAS domain-containing sensor histidine kinase n=1 Tax=Saccharicrinis sp. 156 TaxID=3417574 RepID=UPI003D331172
MNLSGHNYNYYLKRWKGQFGIYAELMNCSIVLLAELKEGNLTAIAYNSPSENNIFFNKDIRNSLSKIIIDNSEAYSIDNLQNSQNKETLEGQAGLKCLYGVPVVDENGKCFASLCMYSREQSYISDEKTNQLETIKIQIEEDILYANKERHKHNITRDLLLSEDEKLKHFFRFSPIGIFYFDTNLIITDLNEKFAEILKSDKQVLLGLNMKKIHDKRVLPILQSALLGVEEEYDGEYLTSTSGAKVNILLKASPVFVNQKIVGGIGILQDTTTRTNIENALKSSENKYRELVEKINDVIFSIDANGICTYVSPVIKLLIGYAADEVIGYHFINFIFESHRITFNDALQKVKFGSTVISEVKIKNKYGTFHWIRCSMRPVYGEDGVFMGIHGIAQDIEETKLAEMSLRESEEQFRLVATNISDIIYEWDPSSDGLTWYGNPSVIQKKFSSINKFSELNLLIHEEDRNKINKLWSEAQKNGVAWKEEFKVLSRNNKPIHILGSGLMLFKDNKPKGFGTLTDVSKEKELVHDLKLSNQKLADNMAKTNSLLSAIPDMMFTFDRSGNITDYHSNDESKLFKKAVDFLNQNVTKILPLDIAELTIEKIAKVLRNKNIETYKYQLPVEGGLQTFESRMVFLDPEHTLAIVRNITTQELAEKELIAAKEKAEESDHLKSSFLANMSHEIRTPMNGIIGFSELLSSKTMNPAEREYYTSVIVKSGHQLLDIINDVLEISKIETGQIQVNNTIVNVSDVFQTMLSFFSKKVLENKVELTTIYPENQEELILLTDDGKLKQILSNLISNAVKFTIDGTISMGYSIIRDAFVEFFVEDNGIGIANEEQKKIFERFSQANPQIMRQHGGTGLGLSISKSLVEILGGSIWVDSKLGKGSKFSFTIPYKKPIIN